MSEIAEKLHRQFAHPSINQIMSLINKAGVSWSNNKDLISEVKRIDKECTTIYRRSQPVYGSCEKILVDNSGDFDNDELINLAKQFGITIKTIAEESPWSNGIIERHNHNAL